MTALPKWLKEEFQPTRPLRGATDFDRNGYLLGVISTHAPLAGRDNDSQVIFALHLISTHAPLAGRDRNNPLKSSGIVNFNPRAPCGARKYLWQPVTDGAGISTHAPLAGRDSKSVQITMHIFAITDKFQMLLHRMPPVRAFCSFLMQENHADFGCEPPK